MAQEKATKLRASIKTHLAAVKTWTIDLQIANIAESPDRNMMALYISFLGKIRVYFNINGILLYYLLFAVTFYQLCK